MRPVELALPFEGRWLVQNSPARRVPSHGSDVMGGRYAIDFVAVDEAWRSSPVRDWRTLLATEPPERFVGFGRPVLAPADGVVVGMHDGEPDHAARRSQLTLAGYALSQASRLRQGVAALAGNHLVLEVDGGFVALVHLRRGSFRVHPGDRVVAGQPLAECGSSGNSTEPHLHLQTMDGPDPRVAAGVPVVFRDFREWTRRGSDPVTRQQGMPGERSVVEPISGRWSSRPSPR